MDGSTSIYFHVIIIKPFKENCWQLFWIIEKKFGTFTHTIWCKVVRIICNIKVLEKLKHIPYENIEQQKS